MWLVTKKRNGNFFFFYFSKPFTGHKFFYEVGDFPVCLNTLILSLFVVKLCLAQDTKNWMFWIGSTEKKNTPFWVIFHQSEKWNFKPIIIWNDKLVIMATKVKWGSWLVEITIHSHAFEMESHKDKRTTLTINICSWEQDYKMSRGQSKTSDMTKAINYQFGLN